MIKIIHKIILTIVVAFMSIVQMLEGQTELLIFEYMENEVKTVYTGGKERNDYTYHDGLIIENSYVTSDWTVERHYYFQEIGKLDSIIYYLSLDDTLYISREYFQYSYQKFGLETIRNVYDTYELRIKVDSFVYRDDGLIDQVYYFENKQEGIFGTRRTDDLRLQKLIKYNYNDSLQLISLHSERDARGWELNNAYSTDGLLITTREYLGHTRRGCFAGDDKKYCNTTYEYDLNGLPVKEVHKYILVKPSGRKKRNGKITFRWRYDYY